MSGLRKVMPVTGVTFAAGWLAICGIIPFAGFFSKDAILASAWAQGEYALWAMGLGTALLTAFYMSRLYFRVFEGPVRTPEGVHAHDASRTMKIALVPLAALSVIGGVINLPGLITLEHFLEPVVGESELPTGIVPWLLAGAALLIAALGIVAARSLYLLPDAEERRARLQRPIGPLVTAARNKFYVDEAYGRAVVLPGKAFATFCADFFDRKVIDGAVNGTAWVVGRAAQGLRRVQTGYVRNYAAAFLVGVVIVFSVLILRIGVR
jgi:NADH-quinone oxidoreductase subunit L